jgi:FtsZ-interacting cell division protein ZipA
MSSNTVILIAIAAIVVVAIIIALIVHGQQKAKRRRLLRDRFGPEYDRLVAATGSSAAAEKELEVRQKRAARLTIRTLSPEEQARFAARWQQVQAEFVDNPKASLGHADDLLAEVMTARGYPVQDFDQRSADLSVDHPVVVQHYHTAHAIALSHKKGEATTEDLRQAMIHYRALFEDLVSDTAPAAPVTVNIPHAAE